MRGILPIVGALFLAIAPGMRADEQLRTPLHVQRGAMAYWLVVPDWFVAKPRVLVAAGRLWTSAPAGSRSWLEVMAGGIANRKGSVDPIGNLRALHATAKLDLAVEGLFNVRARRTTLTLAALMPIGDTARIGVEAEPAFGKGRPDFEVGPKIAVPFRCGQLRCGLGFTYFFKKRDLTRIYMPVYSADW